MLGLLEEDLLPIVIGNVSRTRVQATDPYLRLHQQRNVVYMFQRRSAALAGRYCALCLVRQPN